MQPLHKGDFYMPKKTNILFIAILALLIISGCSDRSNKSDHNTTNEAASVNSEQLETDEINEENNEENSQNRNNNEANDTQITGNVKSPKEIFDEVLSITSGFDFSTNLEYKFTEFTYEPLDDSFKIHHSFYGDPGVSFIITSLDEENTPTGSLPDTLGNLKGVYENDTSVVFNGYDDDFHYRISIHVDDEKEFEKIYNASKPKDNQFKDYEDFSKMSTFNLEAITLFDNSNTDFQIESLRYTGIELDELLKFTYKNENKRLYYNVLPLETVEKGVDDYQLVDEIEANGINFSIYDAGDFHIMQWEDEFQQYTFNGHHYEMGIVREETESFTLEETKEFIPSITKKFLIK